MPYLDVGQGHTLFYETHGNPKGKPLVVLHGGPGGGIYRAILRLFNLRDWFVVLYDQRGCGKSTPRLELKDNTTWHLVEDLERLREHLKIETWALYGGSWGTTLALAYASKYLAHCSAFIFHAVCLFTEEENRWTTEKGYASEVFPNAWANVTKPLRKGTRKILKPYTKLLVNPKTRTAAAKSWAKWEDTLASMNPRPFTFAKKQAVEEAVLEAHYYSHNGWITPELLLKTARHIRVPVILVHGRYDMICPASSAIRLKEAIPHAKLLLIPTAGHSTSQPGVRKVLKQEIQRLVKN